MAPLRLLGSLTNTVVIELVWKVRGQHTEGKARMFNTDVCSGQMVQSNLHGRRTHALLPLCAPPSLSRTFIPYCSSAGGPKRQRSSSSNPKLLHSVLLLPVGIFPSFVALKPSYSLRTNCFVVYYWLSISCKEDFGDRNFGEDRPILECIFIADYQEWRPLRGNSMFKINA